MSNWEPSAQMVVGLLMAVAGGVITLWSYASTDPGDSYYIFWGLAALGGFTFLRGLIMYVGQGGAAGARGRRAEAEVLLSLIRESRDNSDKGLATSHLSEAASKSLLRETHASGLRADWYPDPARRHQLRYWDGNGWTAHVADQGQIANDPDHRLNAPIEHRRAADRDEGYGELATHSTSEEAAVPGLVAAVELLREHSAGFDGPTLGSAYLLMTSYRTYEPIDPAVLALIDGVANHLNGFVKASVGGPALATGYLVGRCLLGTDRKPFLYSTPNSIKDNMRRIHALTSAIPREVLLSAAGDSYREFAAGERQNMIDNVVGEGGSWLAEGSETAVAEALLATGHILIGLSMAVSEHELFYETN